MQNEVQGPTQTPSKHEIVHFLNLDRYLNVNVCVCDAIFPFIGFADVPPVLLSGLSGIFILLSNRSVSLKFAVARSLKKKAKFVLQ